MFINAFEEVKDEKTIAYLLDEHIYKIYKAYINYQDINGFARVVPMEDILKNDASLLVTNYVASSRISSNSILPFDQSFEQWNQSSQELKDSMDELFKMLTV